ncbi:MULTISPECIES: hypothetical protein [Paenibacillus]|uniref:DUF5672 domain-containing protein n=1 Tax=Paenibacillus anseongense TaxID=2682845 RepID=A0ABW9UK34_9BACL|nr:MULTISPECIES: hypothetical protein [Paenibacillus]MBA2938502.1 hypothetical protein [Paenibacillus sp. CGMCC 1.16610]MVQ39620.1 hypothetical protein [Paenibacillus anseongense]
MICMALLAHENEQALRNQIRNIRKYNPQDVQIVFYNGGQDTNFGKKVCEDENVLYCPYSRPLKQRTSGRFFYDVMRFLEDKKIAYEYLVYLEYDIMFVNGGFREYLLSKMEGYDCLVKILRKEVDPKNASWPPARDMWKDWERWKSIFESDAFYRTSSPMSVFRHGIIKKMLGGLNKKRLEHLFDTSNIPCLGEMLYITLAKKYGGKCKIYGDNTKRFLRFRPAITRKEIKEAKSRSDVMFVHPVKDAEVRDWIFNQP